MGKACTSASSSENKTVMNPMRKVKVARLILSINVGEASDRLTKAAKVLEQLTGQRPIFGRARRTIRSFSIRRNQRISCFVTLRGSKARNLLVIAYNEAPS